MIKIVISGGANSLIGDILGRALSNAGISVSRWDDATKNEIAKCVRDAKEEGKHIVLIAMKNGT